MFYVCSLWGMQESERPIYRSLSFLLLFIIMADVAMVANLENVPWCGRCHHLEANVADLMMEKNTGYDSVVKQRIMFSCLDEIYFLASEVHLSLHHCGSAEISFKFLNISYSAVWMIMTYCGCQF